MHCPRRQPLRFSVPSCVRVYSHRASAAVVVAATASDWIPLECIVMLGNGRGVDFQASQYIPMGSSLPLTLTLGVGAA